MELMGTEVTTANAIASYRGWNIHTKSIYYSPNGEPSYTLFAYKVGYTDIQNESVYGFGESKTDALNHIRGMIDLKLKEKK